MNRSGGNNETRYNWQINAHNLDCDWYFESYPDASATPPGATADAFVANSKYGGAQPMITIPMIGWSPKLGCGPRHALQLFDCQIRPANRERPVFARCRQRRGHEYHHAHRLADYQRTIPTTPISRPTRLFSRAMCSI